jgi:hypothetical protein
MSESLVYGQSKYGFTRKRQTHSELELQIERCKKLIVEQRKFQQWAGEKIALLKEREARQPEHFHQKTIKKKLKESYINLERYRDTADFLQLYLTTLEERCT